MRYETRNSSISSQFYQRLWPDADDDLSVDEESGDIEAAIQSEISQLKSKKEKKPFYSVKMAQECGTHSPSSRY